MKTRRKVILLSLMLVLVFSMTGCKSEVNGSEYTFEYNSKTYEGKYTGTMNNNVPDEKGKFVCGNEGDPNYFIYEGSWEAGSMKGEGQLITNNYTVSFPEIDGEAAFDRIGAYNGEVIDGIANGNGTFVAKNDEGVSYTYTGSWKDGLFDGQGKMIYDADDYFIREGNFEKGVFEPSVSEFIQALGTDKNNGPYTLSENMKKYIDENESVFVNHEVHSVGDLIKDDFSLTDFKKSPDTEEPYFVKLSNLEVIQAQEYDAFGRDYTMVICQKGIDDIFYLRYYGKTDNISVGDNISVTVMPVGYSTYETVDQSHLWAFDGWII